MAEFQPDTTVGALIKRLREAASLTQDQLAKRCAMKGMNQAALSLWERDKEAASPSPAQLSAIVAATGGTPADLSSGISLLIGITVDVRPDDTAAVA